MNFLCDLAHELSECDERTLVRPKKKWGQNFLRNRGAVAKIITALDPEPEITILEIGPGEGALTRELALLPNPLVAWEIDPELIELLRSELPPHVQLCQHDATEAALPDAAHYAVGNLPYNVATPIIRRLLKNEWLRRAVFMVQKEVADRFTASPGDRDYGFLTVVSRIHADARRVMTLEPGSFFPPPKVRSAVVRFDPVQRELANRSDSLEPLISYAFRMPRKTIANNLAGYRALDRARALAVLEAAAVPPGARPQELSLGDFDRLATSVARHAAGPAASDEGRR